MNDAFVQRVRAASVAAWWTVALGAAMLTASWLMCLVFLHARPDWARALWGGGAMDWDGLQGLYLRMLAVFKLVLWVGAMAAIFLTLWARRLRREA